ASGVSLFEDWVRDLNGVLGAVGAERPSLLASTDAGPMAMLFAAAYPDRIASLILTNTGARVTPAPDYPYGIPASLTDSFGALLSKEWGREHGSFPDVAWPTKAHDPDFRRWVARLQRAATTPRGAASLFRQELDSDVRRALPLIQAPTLLVSSNFDLVPVANLEYLAEHISNSRLLKLEGKGAFGWLDDADRYLAAIEEHVTGRHAPVEPDRVLATIMFTDIVGSTERASRLGDKKWRELLDRHDQIAQRHIGRFGGRLVKSTGDGVLAVFDGPARAVRCSAALAEDLRREQVEIRVGLHAGEVERRGEDVGGIAVHIAARVMALARPNEILASATVKGLVIGSGLAFQDRGDHILSGLPDTWSLYAVMADAD
ncbi:MAG TPA: adenylate/guanylate cyclase domain-containing protein, partial [Actinomycetota bacterium]|nr:adenylate/guanylate cyclase domain-containing protein [Actinomycetota bacterium]